MPYTLSTVVRRKSSFDLRWNHDLLTCDQCFVTSLCFCFRCRCGFRRYAPESSAGVVVAAASCVGCGVAGVSVGVGVVGCVGAGVDVAVGAGFPLVSGSPSVSGVSGGLCRCRGFRRCRILRYCWELCRRRVVGATVGSEDGTSAAGAAVRCYLCLLVPLPPAHSLLRTMVLPA